MKLPACIQCRLSVLELEGQYEVLPSYYIDDGSPPAASAGHWHLGCLRASDVGLAWQAARLRNFRDVRGYEAAELPGWVLLRHPGRGDTLAIGETGQLLDLSVGRAPVARELEDGVVFARIEKEFHLELPDAAVIAQMQQALEQTGVYALSHVLDALGISDRIVDPVALEGATFRFEPELRALWQKRAVSARLDYGVFVPALLERYARPEWTSRVRGPSLSPGTAFAIAHLPARRVAHAARLDLVERNASTPDPDLGHAVDFSRQALKIEDWIIAEADTRLADAVSAANVSMPPVPTPDGLAAWLATLEDVMKPHLTSSLLDAAWRAGAIARQAAVSAELVAHIAFLRCAAPEDPEMRAEASRHASELRANATALTEQLKATKLPLVISMADSVERPVHAVAEGYRQLNELVANLYKTLETLTLSLDEPPPGSPERGSAHDLIQPRPVGTSRLEQLGARKIKFERGFAKEITIDADALLANWNDLRAAAPLTRLVVRGAKARAGEVVRSPHLATIDSLDLDRQAVTDDDVVALAANAHAARLTRLNLRFNLLTERGIEAIAASPFLKGLEFVSVEPNRLDPVDRQEYCNETDYEYIPTEAGKALEAKYGPLRWLRRR